MDKNFLEAIKNRRTYYSIGNEKIVPEEKIEDIVKNAIKHTPTSFNSQSGRAILLFNEHHEKLWNIVKSTLRKILDDDAYQASEKKINTSFASGYGTVVFFEDQNSVKAMQEMFPLYAEHFPYFSWQSSGMLQYIVWTALELEGLGASLQHYNPLIDEAVRQEWNVPESYKLISQMPFGNRLNPPDEKTFLPIEDRFRKYI